MRKGRGARAFIFFAAVLGGVVLLSDWLVKASQKRASRKSEFAVIERVQSRQLGVTDKSDLVRQFREESIREVHEHFHHLPSLREAEPQHQSQCLMCHSLLPHSKNERIRVMMNMHSDFLSCETCHYKAERESLRYIWYDLATGMEVTQGPRFGTGYDPETGMLSGAEDHRSKITPVRVREGRREPVFMSQDDPVARDYLLVRDHLTPGQRELAKNRFHGQIDGKGWTCKECHRAAGGVLDLQGLGFEARRIQDLESLEVVGLFEKYDVFYLPKW
ncbi:MAG: hypothetical protein AB1640_11415 [bacterium]